MNDERGPVPAGARVAGYRLDEQIGRGGMAVVYRAYDLQLDRQVALKVLDPVLAGDGDFQQRFIRESRAAAAVDHPNIIPVFAAGEADGVLFIAMRYVSGPDVRTLIDSTGPLDARRAVDIVSQVAAALDSAHGRGLVHRDVKPANMLLDPAPGGSRSDHVYLSDFGLSKRALTSLGLTATSSRRPRTCRSRSARRWNPPPVRRWRPPPGPCRSLPPAPYSNPPWARRPCLPRRPADPGPGGAPAWWPAWSPWSSWAWAAPRWPSRTTPGRPAG